MAVTRAWWGRAVGKGERLVRARLQNRPANRRMRRSHPRTQALASIEKLARLQLARSLGRGFRAAAVAAFGAALSGRWGHHGERQPGADHEDDGELQAAGTYAASGPAYLRRAPHSPSSHGLLLAVAGRGELQPGERSHGLWSGIGHTHGGKHGAQQGTRGGAPAPPTGRGYQITRLATTAGPSCASQPSRRLC